MEDGRVSGELRGCRRFSRQFEWKNNYQNAAVQQVVNIHRIKKQHQEMSYFFLICATGVVAKLLFTACNQNSSRQFELVGSSEFP